MMLLLLACSAPTSQDMALLLSDQDSLAACAAMPLPGARITCQVTQAAKAARAGDVPGVDAACLGLEGLWADECRFRSGEELGKAGQTDAALRQCAQAGDYARNCVTHAAWGLPRQPGLSPSQPIGAAMKELEGLVRGALVGAPPGVTEEAVDTLMARAWFNLYVGSGSADPTAARSAGAWAPQARSAWAIEVQRLLPQPDSAAALSCWQGGGCPSGEVLPLEQCKGRYVTPLVPDGQREHPHVAGFGGSVRLLDQDPQVDLQIALLEGAYFREDSGPDVFQAALSSEVDELRWTGCKLTVLAGGQLPEELRSTDPSCVAYAALARRKRARKMKKPEIP